MKAEIEFSTEQIEEIAALAAAKALKEFREATLQGSSTNNPEDIGGIELACQITGLSPSSIYRKSSQGEIPVSRKGGKLYFSRKRLIAWIESGNKQTRSDLIEMADIQLEEKKKKASLNSK